jgi:CelD/BcsL family acetyltransferase involved in cellulose biosynthesis
VAVLRPQDLGDAQTACWRAIHRADAVYASPFFDPAFTELVVAARSDVYVAVLRHDDEDVGFFPFQRNKVGVGYPPGWGLCDYQGPVARRDLDWRASQLLRACGLRCFAFDRLPSAQLPFSQYEQARSLAPVINLADGFERYQQAQRDAGRIKGLSRLRSRWRRLEREYGPVRFEAHVDDPRALAQLLAWKSRQYRRTGMADLLQRNWFRQVIEGAASARSDGFAGMLSALYAGDRPVALHLGLRSHSVWHYWLPAHDVDESLSRCSPGLLLILAMAQAAESLGISCIDFGKGDARHKREFANASVSLSEGVAGDAPLAAAMRGRRRALALARRSRVGPRVRRLVRRPA